jgi:hypothetical protein
MEGIEPESARLHFEGQQSHGVSSASIALKAPQLRAKPGTVTVAGNPSMTYPGDSQHHSETDRAMESLFHHPSSDIEFVGVAAAYIQVCNAAADSRFFREVNNDRTNVARQSGFFKIR